MANKINAGVTDLSIGTDETNEQKITVMVRLELSHAVSSRYEIVCIANTNLKKI